jgi:hypothetical protein
MSGTRNSSRMTACVLQKKQAGWGHQLLSAVSVLVDVLPNSEIPEGLMNYPIYILFLRSYHGDVKIRNNNLKFLTSFVLSEQRS